jgi:hypothetical protein
MLPPERLFQPFIFIQQFTRCPSLYALHHFRYAYIRWNRYH